MVKNCSDNQAHRVHRFVQPGDWQHKKYYQGLSQDQLYTNSLLCLEEVMSTLSEFTDDTRLEDQSLLLRVGLPSRENYKFVRICWQELEKNSKRKRQSLAAVRTPSYKQKQLWTVWLISSAEKDLGILVDSKLDVSLQCALAAGNTGRTFNCMNHCATNRSKEVIISIYLALTRKPIKSSFGFLLASICLKKWLQDI